MTPTNTTLPAPASADRLEATAASTSGPVVKDSPPQVEVRTVTTPDDCIPLTDAQRELWARIQSTPAAVGNQGFGFRLRGPLQGPAMRRAFTQLVARHDALRARFLPGGTAQRFAPACSADMAWDDFSGAPPASREELAAQWGDEFSVAPFDLVNGPLIRASLVRLDSTEHLFRCAVHGLVCDECSLGVLRRELAELYSAEVLGRPATLPPAPSFRAYAVRQPALRSSAAFAAAEEFWRRQLAEEVPVPEMPADRPVPANRTYAGACRHHRLPADLTSVLRRQWQQQGCTAFAGLFAAFAVLLHRLAAQDEIVIGVPAVGQEFEALGEAVGQFVIGVPIHSTYVEERPFGQFLGELRMRMAEAITHGRYPASTFGPEAGRAQRATVAPVVVGLTGDERPGEFAGLVVESANGAERPAERNLSFNFDVTGESIVAGCRYSTELYDDATIARWFGHFETLLRGIVANPDAALADLPLLSERERRQLLVEWNDTALPYDRATTVPELLRQQAMLDPKRVAIVSQGERWSYGELDRRSTAIAELLRGRGVGPGAKIGIYLERSPLLVAAIFGILKAGATYVPLDIAYPQERLAFIMSDTAMRVVLTQGKLRSGLSAAAYDLVALDEPARVEAGGESGARATPDDLAYVLYTSGSTGRPKGVCVPHRCVMALVAWARQHYRPEELAGVLFATSTSFDVSIFECVVPLALGGKIIVAANILEFTSMPAAEEIRLISGVPSAVAELVRNGLIPPGVRSVNLAGEACPPALVDALYALPHIERVYDLYGPTETTVYSTGTLRARGGRATIGRPLPNEQAYILDRRMQPVPIGVRGELYIGGEKLAQGYLNLPKLTEARFLEVPCLRGGRVYRTGDAARFRPDGTIEFLGRLDHQVKIRGHRIEPGEIEAVLAQHPAVRECVVIARSDSSGPRLLGYVVPVAGATVDGAALRTHLLKHLPEYMLPAAVTVLERLPRTASGKIDRPALPDPDFETPREVFVAPRSTAEELLADIWRDVLGLKQVGVHDSFFDLGGHSLLAVQVIVRLQDALNIELTVQQIFLAPTIASLATIVEQALLEQITAGPAGGAAGLVYN